MFSPEVPSYFVSYTKDLVGRGVAKELVQSCICPASQERKPERMLKLPHNKSHFACQQDNAAYHNQQDEGQAGGRDFHPAGRVQRRKGDQRSSTTQKHSTV